mgnify:CR=1 FL=1
MKVCSVIPKITKMVNLIIQGLQNTQGFELGYYLPPDVIKWEGLENGHW